MGGNCLNSVPYLCYTFVQIIAIGSIGQLSDCSCMSLQCMLVHVHSLCHKPVIWRYQLGMQPKRTLTFIGLMTEISFQIFGRKLPVLNTLETTYNRKFQTCFSLNLSYLSADSVYLHFGYKCSCAVHIEQKKLVMRQGSSGYKHKLRCTVCFFPFHDSANILLGCVSLSTVRKLALRQDLKDFFYCICKDFRKVNNILCLSSFRCFSVFAKRDVN